MKNTRFNYLFERYFKGLATLEESNEFLNIVEDDLNKGHVQELMEVYWKSVASEEEVFFSETQRDRMFIAIFNVDQPINAKPNYKLWTRFASVAAVVAIIASGIYFFTYNKNKTRESQATSYLNDIAPGKVGATLTLANGRTISLADARNGELANEAGISISKTANGQVVYELKENSGTSDKINTLTTSNGETYILTLPDKSKVWMNAASSLTYNMSLNEGGVRKVKLEGEAYFEISKDKTHPFIVESNNQQVEVLGTHFNVNAYKDETAIRTTLLEGSVKVSENGTSKILIPGNQAINQRGEINIHEVNTNLVTAWKNNKFIFDRLSIQEIMRMVSRWYNVEIIYEGTAPVETFWGSVSRFENVSEVLSPLEKTGNVHFKIDGRRIYVSR